MGDLNLTIIQPDLFWHDINANLAMFEEKLWQLDQQSDLVILPEMFTTGFTMEADKLAEPMYGKTFRWMEQQATQHEVVIVGSYIVKEKRQFYNRLIWMEPNGTYAFYDKRHLFRMAKEDIIFSKGQSKFIKEVNSWRVCPLICYDLRFPVWCRNNFNEGYMDYDLLIFIANWPKARVTAWNTLLRARAMENLCLVAGVNRVGSDGNDIIYNGQSTIVDAKGNHFIKQTSETFTKTITLNKSDLEDFRTKFPAYLDADDFSIN